MREIDHVTLAKWSLLACLASLAVAIGSSMIARRLPPPAPRPELRSEPVQTPVIAEIPRKVSLHGHTYEITPRFNYHLTGLVVEKSDAMGWMDISHKSWGDYLNTNDLCVIWGENAERLDLSRFKFGHGDWTCWVSTRSNEAWAKFKMDGLSNNHILPSTVEMVAQLADVHIGDQIQIDGQLVDYSTDGLGKRTTSTTRTDAGNGACEIIYVTDFKFLARHNLELYRLSHLAMRVALISAVSLLISLFILPFVWPRRRTS